MNEAEVATRIINTTMPLLVQRTFSASSQKLRQTSPAGLEKTGPLAAKSVSFSSNVDVQEVPHLVDMSAEDNALTWYSKDECRVIKETVIAIIRSMVEDRLEKDECTRGLEHRTPEASRQRKQNKRHAFKIVWDAQESQWEDGKTDGEAIAILYQMETFKSKEKARTWGIHDEKAAKSIHAKKRLSSKVLRYAPARIS